MDQPRVRNLTNTEKVALTYILNNEEKALATIKAFKSSFESDLRVRLGIGAAGALRIDVAAGTVEIIPDDLSPPN